MASLFNAGVRWVWAAGIVTVTSLAILLYVVNSASADQMVATWYGQEFAGSPTASGETFDPNGYTAAHKTLPFGTKLLVTYQGKSVVVRINDRGPYSDGVDLDLSEAAAGAIGFKNVGYDIVEANIVDPGTPVGPYAGSSSGAGTTSSGAGTTSSMAPAGGAGAAPSTASSGGGTTAKAVTTQGSTGGATPEVTGTTAATQPASTVSPAGQTAAADPTLQPEQNGTTAGQATSPKGATVNTLAAPSQVTGGTTAAATGGTTAAKSSTVPQVSGMVYGATASESAAGVTPQKAATTTGKVKLVELPKTGGPGYPIFTLLIVGGLMIGGGLIFRRAAR